MKKKSLLITGILIVLLSAAGFLAFRFYSVYYFTTEYQPKDYTASNRTLQNPYRGWYHIYGYVLSDTAPIDIQKAEKTAKHDTNELALLEINLRSYTTADITESGLSQLESLLLCWKNEEKQLILRFLYDWDGRAKETEPKDISIIKRHMEQTAAIVNRYKDCVYLMQGVYIGNCGEMNNSDYMTKDNLYALATHLNSVVDPDIYLAVRTPAHWRFLTGLMKPLPAEDAFSGSIAARYGLYNDGMLGSANDLGTYSDKSLALAKDFLAKGTRGEELAFQNTLCSFVPNGGEVVLDNEYNDFTNALGDLKKMHISYLDCDYDKAVLDKWLSSTYNGGGCFNGSDGCTYIGEHLGYRYAVTSSDFTFETLKPDCAVLTLSIENSGFSCSYRPFQSEITVLDESGSVCAALSIDADSRFWDSGETVTLSAPIDVRALGVGSYKICYRLFDPVLNRSIELANTLETSSYGLRIAELIIDK